MKPIYNLQQSRTRGLSVVAGLILMVFCENIKIPFIPISFTLHTFGVALCGLCLTPQKAFLAITGFLLFKITTGLNFSGMAVGFYFGFPIAGLVISLLKNRVHQFGALCIGQLVTYFFGVTWMVPLLGWQTALVQGAGVFVFTDLIKNGAAMALTRKARQ